MLFASIIVYLVLSIFIYPRLFEKASFSKLVLVFFLTVFSINIFTSEILGLLHLLNHPWLFIWIQFLISLSISLIAHRFFPLSLQTFRSTFYFSNFHLSKLELVLISLITATFIGLFVVGITTPINNLDSLATHLPRIYYWLQHGSFDYWTTSNLSQLTYPINTLIQGLWLFLLGQSENLFFLVQWFSLIILTASVFELSKSLGFSNTQALMSSLIGLSLPVVLLQSFSVQGDLTVTALVLTSITFLLLFSQSKRMKFLWTACFSFILALGSKQTAFFILPAIGFFILYLLIKNKKIYTFTKSSWLLLVFLFFFSSFQFAQNILNTGSLFGSDSLLNEEYSSVGQVTQKALYVIPRFTYQFMGVEGLPRSIQPTLTNIKENIFTAILQPSGLDLEKKVFLQSGYDENESFQYQAIPRLSEDTAWFGPFAILFIPLSTILSVFSKNKLRRNYAIICFINSIIYIFLVIIQRPGWDPYQGRYFILSLLPFIPLVSMLLPKKAVLRGIVIGTFVPICLLLIINTTLLNDSKPIITARTQNDIINNYINPLPENSGIQKFFKKTLLKLTYPTSYSSQLVNIYEATYYDRLFFSSLYSVKDIEFIHKILPEGEPLSILITRSPIEYALFGKNRSRSVNPISEISDARQGYVLVSNSLALSPPSNMNLLGKNSVYSIYFVETN